MRVRVLSWSEIDLDINEEEIVERLHKELDEQLDYSSIQDSLIDIDVSDVVDNLIREKLVEKDIAFEDYDVID